MFANDCTQAIALRNPCMIHSLHSVAYPLLVLQGVGVVGLWQLTKLRVLHMGGNKDLVVSDVLAALTGKVVKSAVPEVVPSASVEPLHTLELVSFGLPTPTASKSTPITEQPVRYSALSLVPYWSAMCRQCGGAQQPP